MSVSLFTPFGSVLFFFFHFFVFSFVFFILKSVSLILSFSFCLLQTLFFFFSVSLTACYLKEEKEPIHSLKQEMCFGPAKSRLSVRMWILFIHRQLLMHYNCIRRSIFSTANCCEAKWRAARLFPSLSLCHWRGCELHIDTGLAGCIQHTW